VAAPLRRSREATKAAQTGWSLQNLSAEATTLSAPRKDASRYSLDVASTPPSQGGEW
jgi:hypothetical protein